VGSVGFYLCNVLTPWITEPDRQFLLVKIESSLDVMGSLSNVLQKLGSLRTPSNLAHPALDNLHLSWQAKLLGGWV
jgi:hypothetical protein